MDFYAHNQAFSGFGSNGGAQFWGNSNGFSGDCGDDDGIVAKSSQSLVLDEEKGEIVKAVGKKMGLLGGEKALAALKSHSEAERRRRERINAHMDTLRGLIPTTDKMDKATLLGEVIRQVKHLKTAATEAGSGLLIPQDSDEVKLEKLAGDNGISTFRTSFCCKHAPGLLTDLRQALAALKLTITTAELSTLGDRVKVVFDLTANGLIDEVMVNSIHKALTNVVKKGSISPDYSPRTTIPNKRMRYSL